MSEIPEELVEKAGLAIRRGFGTAATDDGDVIYTDLIEDVAREALTAVLPDVRRTVAEEIAVAIWEGRAKYSAGIDGSKVRVGLACAARIAREVGEQP